ncbi:hypothetical protein DFA_06411 [Cavenderia fasciculata]|uniref:Uncharacterized protein n=1 Tax=Cavenderia fasciculata TaxID=261658 RepID=F4PIX5_CACFS|nr:uncharacterized protein DFA_06411 [Cavenderia fasciculata]EGG24261.1 hypothetical protein DFA_06411 [Cavenderia fasciculata]|eukprot:XP_004362112.1 hypothetical protein DFA_06411 [Cavenderia fasciculata]
MNDILIENKVFLSGTCSRETGEVVFKLLKPIDLQRVKKVVLERLIVTATSTPNSCMISLGGQFSMQGSAQVVNNNAKKVYSGVYPIDLLGCNSYQTSLKSMGYNLQPLEFTVIDRSIKELSLINVIILKTTGEPISHVAPVEIILSYYTLQQ